MASAVESTSPVGAVTSYTLDSVSESPISFPARSVTPPPLPTWKRDFNRVLAFKRDFNTVLKKSNSGFQKGP